MRSLMLLLLAVLTAEDIQLAALQYGPQASVDAAFSTYVRLLENHVADPHLGIYSPETQKFLESRRITEAQQRNELTEIQAVYSRRTIMEAGDLAVMRFSGSTRVPPYFFRKRATGWTIDLSATSRVIGFDQSNQWYVRDPRNEFAFGL